MLFDLINRRRQSRYYLPADLQYFLTAERSDIQAGVVSNVSSSGLCMLSREHLAVGQVLFLEKNILPIDSGTLAVRWVKPLGYLFRVGLEITR